MQDVVDALQANAGILALVGLILALLALVIASRASRNTSYPLPELPVSTTLVDDPALDQILSTQMQRLDAAANDIQGLTTRIKSVESSGRSAVQHAGLVRFNPFREDTGGNLSFALALLDADDNGIVLSSLHSRQTTRVYIKAITDGQPDQTLSDEENRALRQARGDTPSAS